MNGTRVARRAALLGQRRLVLFEDRLEEHFLSVFGLEVRRLFFDEVECATVRPQRQALEIVLAALAVSLGLITAGVALAASQRPVAAAGFLLALVFGAILLLVLLWPPWQLVIRAGGEELRSLLPRRAGARQQALRRLTDAVRLHQRKNAAPAPAAPAPPPAHAAPTAGPAEGAPEP